MGLRAGGAVARAPGARSPLRPRRVCVRCAHALPYIDGHAWRAASGAASSPAAPAAAAAPRPPWWPATPATAGERDRRLGRASRHAGGPAPQRGSAAPDLHRGELAHVARERAHALLERRVPAAAAAVVVDHLAVRDAVAAPHAVGQREPRPELDRPADFSTAASSAGSSYLRNKT